MLTQGEIKTVLEYALSSGGDFAEIFFEDRDENNIKSSDRIMRGMTSVKIHGAGIYVLCGVKSVYVYNNNTSYSSLIDTARQAAELLSSLKRVALKDEIVFSMEKHKSPNPVVLYPSEVNCIEKQRVVRETDLAARSAGLEIRQLNVDCFDTDQRILIANSEGLYTQDRRVTSRLRIQATVGEAGRYLYDWDDYTKPMGFEAFRVKENYTEFASGFIKSIAKKINALSVAPCIVPVVFEAGSCGTLWHESCGHPLEASAIASNQSEFAGHLGQQVASPKVTLIDDGTMKGMYGSSSIDDEGHKTRRNILIENGILKGYLCDRLGGRRLSMASTGNGRRQNYTYAPSARMTNTYLAPGNDDEDEMIRSIDQGLFVTKIGGGNGGREFSVEVSEGYWIKNGQIDHQVKGLMLNGKGIDIIKLVDRVGSKLVPEKGGFCGAVSGLCCTTSFQPRMRISSMSIGGEGR